MTTASSKIHFTIGEVSKIAGVKPHVLRFWESEFPSLSPRKDDAGRRVYRKRDLETVITIRRLLYDEKFTIAGARRALMSGEVDPPEPETIETIANELRIILALLKEG